jgi:hypothetical protein
MITLISRCGGNCLWDILTSPAVASAVWSATFLRSGQSTAEPKSLSRGTPKFRTAHAKRAFVQFVARPKSPLGLRHTE